MKKHNQTMGQRFLRWYMLLVLLPVAVLSVLFIQFSFRSFENMAVYASKSSFVQTEQLLEYYINNVNDEINSLLGMDEFHKVLEKDNSGSTKLDQINDMLYIRGLLNACRNKKEISDVYLYLDNEAIYIGSNSQIRTLDDAKEQPWYSYVEDSYPGAARIPSSYLGSNQVIGYAKAIRSSRSYQTMIGILFFQINKNILTSYLGDSETAQISVINDRGELIAQTGQTLAEVPEELLMQHADGEYHVVKLGKSSYYLYTRKLENTDWYLVYLDPYESMVQLLIKQGTGYLLFFFLILALGLVFFYLFFCSYLKRISGMKQHMSRIRESLPAPMTESGKGDEIDDLILSYNYMLGRVNTLMKEQYELGNQIKEIEMKALYEQINPHFLYNTLTMINWLAEDGQTEDVSRVITALSAFYRLSLNKGNENIYLKEELEIARNFIYIQQMRFGTDIRLECQVDPVYDKFVIPKLTLQPLIENSLVHGILMRRDKSGVITVSVSDEDGWLFLTITDTGEGMNADTVEQLNRGTLQSQGKHYGVWNVMKRAGMYYGKPCSLVYSSEPGKGTTAILKLPYAEPGAGISGK